MSKKKSHKAGADKASSSESHTGGESSEPKSSEVTSAEHDDAGHDAETHETGPRDTVASPTGTDPEATNVSIRSDGSAVVHEASPGATADVSVASDGSAVVHDGPKVSNDDITITSDGSAVVHAEPSVVSANEPKAEETEAKAPSEPEATKSESKQDRRGAPWHKEVLKASDVGSVEAVLRTPPKPIAPAAHSSPAPRNDPKSRLDRLTAVADFIAQHPGASVQFEYTNHAGKHDTRTMVGLRKLRRGPSPINSESGRPYYGEGTFWLVDAFAADRDNLRTLKADEIYNLRLASESQETQETESKSDDGNRNTGDAARPAV